jgi:hypothetical protein
LLVKAGREAARQTREQDKKMALLINMHLKNAELESSYLSINLEVLGLEDVMTRILICGGPS